MQGSFLHADPNAGVNGTGALRMDWPKSTTCSDDWTGLDHAIPGAPTEIYIQFSVKYQPGFQFDWLNAGASPCAGNAKKLFLVWSGDNRSRFIYVAEDHDLRAASDYEDALGTNRSQNGRVADFTRPVCRRQLAPRDLPHQAEFEHHRDRRLPLRLDRRHTALVQAELGERLGRRLGGVQDAVHVQPGLAGESERVDGQPHDLAAVGRVRAHATLAARIVHH